MMMIRWIYAVLLMLLSFTTAADDLAASRVSPWYAGDGSQFQLDVGIGAEIEPDYVGSDDYLTEPDATLTLHWRPSDSFRMALTPGTLGAVWEPNDRWIAQLVIEAEEGREAGETEDLKALNDGEDTVEGELTIGRRFGERSFAYMTYQPELQDRGKGQVWFLGAGTQFAHGDNLRLTATADLSWGDAEHMMTEFGLNQDQATRLNQPRFDIGGGLKSTTVGLTLEWQPWERVTVQGSIELEYYFDDAAKSPLIDVLGSRQTYEAEVGVIYRF